jgi:hypothetical protein
MESPRRPAADVDVDQLAAQVTQLASSQRLVLVPATPLPKSCSGHLVLLGNDDLSAADFCQLAANAGARLLYVQAEAFDAGSDLALMLGDYDQNGSDRRQSAKIAALRHEAESLNGRVRQLELAFAAKCVLHYWAVTADWYDSLLRRAAELLPYEEP